MKANGFIAGFLRSSVMFVVAIAPGSLWGEANFVYTNNNPAGSNTVSALSVDTNGALAPIAGSPFPSGGTGDGGGYAANRVLVSGKLLFASNSVSADVSVFTIDPTSGALTSVAGSPFKTGAMSGVIALAATPDGKFLMATTSSAKTVSVFSVATNGVLTLVSQSPTASTPDAAKVSPNGKFLAVAEPLVNAIEIFSIAADGSLTSLGTFAGSGISGLMANVDINCANNMLYASEYNATGTIVDAYRIGSGGTLTAISGSPFTSAGADSAAVLLSPDDKTLFVSDAIGDTVAVASVAVDGSLSFLAGSPFAMIHPSTPAGMATSVDGSFLYVANYDNVVSVFSVAANGTPTEVAGSPFSTGATGPGGLRSLAAFPPKVCGSPANIDPQPVPPPVTTAVATPGPNTYGWNNTNVLVTLSATDAGGPGLRSINYTLSGAQAGTGSIAGASGTIPITAEGVTTLTFFAQDTAGNKENAKTLTVQIDKTPPTLTATLSPPPNASGWNNSNVTVQFTASDALSGVASVSSPVTLTTDGKNQAVTGNATDRAGNTAFLTVTVNIDRTPPVISGMPVPGCSLWPPNHQLVKVANVSATDALSGIAPGSFRVTATSNEAVNATGSGQTAPDIVISGGSVQLRAERSGSGTGRVYTIQATAADLAGNVAKTSGVCVVPHNSGGAQ